jgi:hypothetical protein
MPAVADVNPNRTRLQELVGTRRKALRPPVSQAALAKAANVKSPELISLVEAGWRRFKLDRIPYVADALRIKRIDLIKLELHEKAPMVYKELWGSTDPFDAASVSKSEVSQATTFDGDFMTKFHSLPQKSRNMLTMMLEELYESSRAQVHQR